MSERFNGRARRVIDLPDEQARGHILLGLIQQRDGIAAQVLVALGCDLNRVRQQVIQLLVECQGDQGGLGRFTARPSLPRRTDKWVARRDPRARRFHGFPAVRHRTARRYETGRG